MKILHGFDSPADYRGGYVSIGNFDGVHRGHQSMAAALIRRARAAGAPAVALTFDPHPIRILRPAQAPPALTTTDRKLELLAECGIDATIVYPTDRALLDLTPREFFETVVQGELAAAGLVEGPNFFFGHNRAGNVQTLEEFCRSAAISLEIVPPVQVGNQLVSSTEVRGLLAAGRVAQAAELLGHNYRLRGVVVYGAARGRTIGFPTANLAQVETVVPRDGVYAARALYNGQWFAAAMNVGSNPTFADQQRKIEVHCIDFTGDLYGHTLDVELLEHLRDTTPFADIGALQEQLRCDINRARALANALPAG